jgi:hypothetical protein
MGGAVVADGAAASGGGLTESRNVAKSLANSSRFVAAQ